MFSVVSLWCTWHLFISITSCLNWVVGGNWRQLDKSLLHHREIIERQRITHTHVQTYLQFRMTSQTDPRCISLDGGKKLQNLEGSHMSPERRCKLHTVVDYHQDNLHCWSLLAFFEAPENFTALKSVCECQWADFSYFLECISEGHPWTLTFLMPTQIVTALCQVSCDA